MRCYLCFNAWFLMIPTVRVGYLALVGEGGECGGVPDILSNKFERFWNKSGLYRQKVEVGGSQDIRRVWWRPAFALFYYSIF